MTRDAILDEREQTHGCWARQAHFSQQLKALIRERSASLSLQQQEALDQIAVKVSRILHGNPSYVDHWLDIAGYAKLAAEATPQAPQGASVYGGGGAHPQAGRVFIATGISQEPLVAATQADYERQLAEAEAKWHEANPPEAEERLVPRHTQPEEASS